MRSESQFWSFITNNMLLSLTCMGSCQEQRESQGKSKKQKQQNPN